MYPLLLKTFIQERLSLRRLFGQKIARSKIQSVLMVLLLVYAFGVTAFSNSILQYEIAQGLKVIGDLSPMLFQVVNSLSALGFLFGFFQAQGYLFQYKDFDLLGPLPIPQRTIVAAKISIMLVFVYLFALIMVVPTYGIWWYESGAPLIQLFIFLPMALVAPIPLMLLGAFVSFLLRKLTQKWLHANVLQTVFSVLFILSFASFNFLSNEIIPVSWIGFIQGFDVVGHWFVLAISDLDVLRFVMFFGLHLIVLFTFVLVMSGPLLKINQQRTNLLYKRNEKIPNHQQSVMSHLLKKEWQRFVGTSIYFINTGFGILMLILLTAVSLFIPSAISEVRQLMVAMGIEPIWLIFGIVGFSLSTVYTPAVSLSLEGKNINLLKSLPIEGWTIIKAKIFFNLLLTIPVVLFASVIGSSLFQLDFLIAILFIIMLVLFTILLSIFFMYINLWFPRFDFHQEVEVVKQSLAPLVAVFGGFSLLGALLWLNFEPLASLDLYARLITLSGIEFFFIGIALWFLKTNAQRYFQSFSV